MARNNQEVDASVINIIRSGTEIKGDINCMGDIRIDGKVIGNLRSEGKVVVGENGMIEGEVDCLNATISGGLKVTIRVKELLSLKSTANLVGEIQAGKLQIEPGANFSGTCKMGTVMKGLSNNDGIKKEERNNQEISKGKTA